MKRLALLLGVAALTGCGGGGHSVKPVQPQLPRALAQPWRAQADGVAAALAAGDGCLALQRATALRTAVIAAVNRRALAPRFQEPLVGAVNDLTARIRCTPPPAPPKAPKPHHEKPPKHHHHGKHKK
jgi:hypothetical protein